jgi:DNA-binding transcriptional LysR family regulator
MDRLRCLEVFAEVARSGSFTAAAQRFGVSRATVTKQVAWLERSLNAQLLNRTTKQVGLTEAGLRVLASGSKLLERYEEIESDVREVTTQPRGMIRVGTPPSFGAHHLVPIVRGFLNRQPDIQVAMVIDVGHSNLVADGLDLSIRIAPSLEDASFIAQPLVKAPQVLVAAPAYLKRAGRPKRPEDLVKHNCLLHMLKAPTGIWRFGSGNDEVTVRVRGSLCSNFGEALQQAALAGEGLSIHPTYMVAKDIAAGRLVVVMPEHAPTGLDISVIYSSGRSQTRRLRLFLQYLKEWARTPPQWSLRLAGPRAGMEEH